MIRNFLLIGIMATVFLFFIFIRNKDAKRLKSIILFAPLILGAIMYGSIFYLTKDMPPDVCDGGALMGILISFILIGMGLLLNFINISYLIINKIRRSNLRYKKYFILIILASLIIFLFFRHITKVHRRIAKDLEIKVPFTLEFQYEDSHGGFHGDGIMLAKASLNEKEINKIIKESKRKWMKTPLPKNINLVLYGGKNDDNYYESDLSKRLSMSRVENGYWIFVDRFRGERTFNEGENLFPIVSNNYSLGVIDLDRNVFYYIEYDS